MKNVAGELDSLIRSWVKVHIGRRLKSDDQQSLELAFIDVMLSLIEEDSNLVIPEKPLSSQLHRYV